MRASWVPPCQSSPTLPRRIGLQMIPSHNWGQVAFHEAMVHAASETAFVTFWVMIAYLVFDLPCCFLVSNKTWLGMETFHRGGDCCNDWTHSGLWATNSDCLHQGDDFIPSLGRQCHQPRWRCFVPLLVRHKAASLWATVHTIPALITVFSCWLQELFLELGIQWTNTPNDVHNKSIVLDADQSIVWELFQPGPSESCSSFCK